MVLTQSQNYDSNRNIGKRHTLVVLWSMCISVVQSQGPVNALLHRTLTGGMNACQGSSQTASQLKGVSLFIPEGRGIYLSK